MRKRCLYTKQFSHKKEEEEEGEEEGEEDWFELVFT